MAGYCGFSMSNNAKLAYATGEKPVSKWTKTAIIAEFEKSGFSPDFLDILKKQSIKILRKACLGKSSWHHTSKMYNETDFYTVSVDCEESEILEMIEKVSDEIKKESEKTPEKWLVKYAVWYGNGRYKKCEWCEDVGIISGNWFISEKSGKRKNISGNWFKKIERIS